MKENGEMCPKCLLSSHLWLFISRFVFVSIFIFIGMLEMPISIFMKKKKKMHFERVNRITFNWKMTKMKTSYVLFIQISREKHTYIVCALQCLSVVVSLTDNVHLLVSFFSPFISLKLYVHDVNISNKKEEWEKNSFSKNGENCD